MGREFHVRFREGPGVQFPRATRLVVLARSRRQLERVVLPRLRAFLAARGLRLSEEKTRIVRDTQGFDFVGRHFKRLTPTKFLVRPRRSSIRAHLNALSQLFRNRAIPVGVQIQMANTIIRGFCNHYRTDHSSRVFQRLTLWTLRTFCKWVSRRNQKMTAAQAYRRLTRVNGQKFTMPTAYTPQGKMVSLLAHSRFHRLRHQQVKGTNSPLDPRLKGYWEERRIRSLLRRALADAHKLQRYLLARQNSRCAITGLPLEDLSLVEIHHIIPKHVGGHDDWSNLCLVLRWAHIALHASQGRDYSKASLKDVPFSGL